MKVEKKKLINNDSDLKFTPLDLKNPLQLEKLNLNSLTPTNSFDGVSINSDCNNIYIGFPSLGLSSQFNNAITPNASIDSTKITEYFPLTPYPMNIPSIDLTNTSNNNTFTKSNSPSTSSATNNSNNEYPSELNSDDLYSYNSINNRDSLCYTTTINPLDILRNFNFSLDDTVSRDSSSNKKIDEIFTYMQENNPGLFSTLKAYRIPFPIATLLIKKIIKVTLEHK